MNIIQIARKMGESLTFGDLPESMRIVGELNNTIGDERLTTTSTGKDLIDIYEESAPSMQNKLASVFEEDYKLREAIMSDIVLWETSERKRVNMIYQQTVKLSFIGVIILVSISLYLAFSYHKMAEREMGDNYQSIFLETLDSAYQLIDDVAGKK